MAVFPGGDRGHEQHNSLLESFCWNLPFLTGTLTGLHKRMTELWEKLQVEQSKVSLLHSSKPLQVLTVQSCSHSPATTAPAPGEPWEAADTRQGRLF